jgi:hypothetical protein
VPAVSSTGRFFLSIAQGALMTWTFTEDNYRALVKSDDECLHGLAEVKTQLALIVRLLNGNPDEDIPGVRPRLMLVERRMTTIPDDLAAQVAEIRRDLNTEKEKRSNLEQRWIGVKWILGGLGITSASLAAIVGRLLFGGP